MTSAELRANVGPYGFGVEEALDLMQSERAVPRLWAHDHTLWRDDPTEITNRLGWLHGPEDMVQEIDRLYAFVSQVKAEGFAQVLLLGMGGSSLAPELFGKSLAGPHGLNFSVLDSTDPAAVAAQQKRLDPRHTLVIVSTKSGGTVETISLFKAFWNWMSAALGKQDVGDHFVAITDPGSSLADLARKYQFRTTFINDPNLGGRYSGLSFFGLVPAALVDVDLRRLLGRAVDAARQCGADVAPHSNPGAHLAAILYVLAEAGRDKVTFVTSPALASFGDWVEQLIAESTGKQGRGLVPVVGEPVGDPSVYGSDRVFVHLYLQEAPVEETSRVAALEAEGHPVVRMKLQDRYDMGAQFFMWEMATALVCSRWKINAFDQPDVESAKVVARDLIKQYLGSGRLPAEKPAWQGKGIAVYTGDGDSIGVSTGGCAEPAALIIDGFLRQAVAGSYVAIQAYLQPSEEADAAILALRTAIRGRSKLAVTTGYGPRFLHSTGQLHKGDAGHGLFLQVTANPASDVGIPDEAGEASTSVSFGTLIAAQALGDWGALRAVGRRALRLHMEGEVVDKLGSLAKALS